MFVARSAGRIRLARLAFIVAGILPLGGLVASAVHLRSAGHRDAVRGQWQRAIGLPLAIGRIVHPRPGVIRAEGVVVSASDGAPVLSLPVLEVETTPGEVRLRVPAAVADAASTALLGGLAREWLGRGARFDRDCVIDVTDFAWRSAVHDPPTHDRGPDDSLRGPLRVECVSQDGARGLRVVRGPAEPPADADVGDAWRGGRAAPALARDELRVVRAAMPPGPIIGAAAPPGTSVEANCAGGLPFAILAALAPGMPVEGWTPGPDAVVSGSLAAANDGGGWRFTATGRVERVDLRTLAASIGLQAEGAADVGVSSLEWRDGRLAACDLAIDVGPGHVERRFLEALVTVIGCRPGPALVADRGDGQRSRFDAASCRLRLSAAGLELTSAPRLGGVLAVADGLPLLEPPGTKVAGERLAWLVAAPGAGYAPATGPGAWLMSILPVSPKF